MAKRELERDREILMSRSLPGLQTDNSDNSIPNNNETNDSDSDSDTESDDKGGELLQEINDITSDIELKSKLIEQLELSQQRMMVMKQHYEEKLNVLSAKIANTQKERDQVLANLGGNMTASVAGGGNEKVKKVRDEYEKKLGDLQKELRKLQSAQKEHLRQQREIQSQEAQLKQLRTDLGDLKSNKIRLMRKMQEESNRHKEEESRKMREIAQLRKEARKQMNMIKSLQAQGAAKDQVLKRKTEEVSALRKTQRGKMSSKAAGKVQPTKASLLQSSRQSRLRWESLQRTITRAARSKQAVLELERELERLLNDREMICRDLASVSLRENSISPPIDRIFF
jgi:kinesin family member 21